MNFDQITVVDNLDTHSFQAPDCSRHFGFERIGAVEEYPRGHTKIFMCKRLR